MLVFDFEKCYYFSRFLFNAYPAPNAVRIRKPEPSGAESIDIVAKFICLFYAAKIKKNKMKK